jgi:hypothetical protein
MPVFYRVLPAPHIEKRREGREVSSERERREKRK